MLRQRRKSDIKPDVMRLEVESFVKNNARAIAIQNTSSGSLRDYIKFVFYCMLLAVPLYAITTSILKRDWVMVIIDALIVPVGFVHGLLLLFGYTS